MPELAQRVRGFGTTIFTVINELARDYNAINLGQGAPNYDAPAELVATMTQAAQAGKYNQYAPSQGVPQLREALASHLHRFYGIEVDLNGGLVVTCGASAGIFASIFGSIDPGDEVILLEPFFDIYLPIITTAGGIPRFVPLEPPNWTLNAERLREAFNEKTRAIIVNSPNNPTGRVFTHEELMLIAELCIEHDVICISDEAYDHLVFEGHQHIPMATLPNMWERTLTVGTAAKTFSVTGWKIGWVFGDPHLMTGAWRAHQISSFAIHHPAQFGVAHGLQLDDRYFTELIAFYDQKRQRLTRGLDAIGMPYFMPEGAFYVMADFSRFHVGNSEAFAKYLIQEVGVATIPPTSFYSEAHQDVARQYVRFAFCKTDEVLDAAVERLQKLRPLV